MVQVWLLFSSMPLTLLPKLIKKLQDTKSSQRLYYVLPPQDCPLSFGTSPSPGVCSPFWPLPSLLCYFEFWYLTLLLGALGFWIKFLLSHSIISLVQIIFFLCHSFNSLLCSEDSPALLRLSVQLSTRQLHLAVTPLCCNKDNTKYRSSHKIGVDFSFTPQSSFWAFQGG